MKRNLILACLAGVIQICLAASSLTSAAAQTSTPNTSGDLPEDVWDEIREAQEYCQLISPETDSPVVVISEQATEAEKFAAQELAWHLEQITGREIQVTTEQEVPDGRKILSIGRNLLNTDYDEEVAGLGAEEYLIDVAKDKITIIGGSLPPIKAPDGRVFVQERGILYGVYEFLEGLGVRWYRPEEWGWHIPKAPSIKLAVEKKVSSKPVFFGRSAVTRRGQHPELLDLWSVRQRLNVALPPRPAPQNQYGDRVRISLGHTHSNKIITPEKYLPAHPEYYALIDGERAGPGKGQGGEGPRPQLCLGNPELQQEFANVVIEYAKQNPQELCIAVDPEDGTQLGRRMCSCSLCLAMDDPENPELMSNRIFAFTNIIAKKLAEAVPGAKVGLYAYSMHTEAPALVDKLEPNVIVGLANINSWTDLSKKPTDPTSPQNSRFLRLVQDWKKIAQSPLWMREYSAYGWVGVLPMYRLLQERIQSYRDLGMEGFIWRGEPSFGPQLLLLYLKAQLQWNPNLDLDKELDLFYSNYYGPAAVPMKAYHEGWMKAFEESNISKPTSQKDREGGAFGGVASGGRGMHLVCSPSLIRELGGYIDQAQKLVEDQPLYKRRLHGTVLGYEGAKQIGEVVSLKLVDGKLEQDPLRSGTKYFQSSLAEAKWKDFEKWLAGLSADEDEHWDAGTGLRYMRRDILQGGRFIGWNEPELLVERGFESDAGSRNSENE